MKNLLTQIPTNASSLLNEVIIKHQPNIQIVNNRKTKLGDFRPFKQSTIITINKGLNPYIFLITLLHEIAHLICWKQYGNTIKPHGTEWKNKFSSLLIPFLGSHIFPNDIKHDLITHIKNPKASICNDIKLYKSLHKHKKNLNLLIEDIPLNSTFRYGKKKIFIKIKKLKKRYLCCEIATKKKYLFNPITEVSLM